jgi:hypothetical protein
MQPQKLKNSQTKIQTMTERPPILHDYESILLFIEQFANSSGLKQIQVDANALRETLAVSTNHPPELSLFKRVATFICAFSYFRPVQTPFPENVFGKMITQIPNHQNAILAFEIAKNALWGASLRSADGRNKIINNQISMSAHMYADTITFLSNLDPSKDVFGVALLLESLCYQSNSELAYSNFSKQLPQV